MYFQSTSNVLKSMYNVQSIVKVFLMKNIGLLKLTEKSMFGIHVSILKYSTQSILDL